MFWLNSEYFIIFVSLHVAITCSWTFNAIPSSCLSALRLAISPERVVRSTSFLACGRGPAGPRICVRQERRDSAESIIRAAGVRISTPGEARQRRVYNAIRVDSVPSCKLGPARTRPRVHLHCSFDHLCSYCGWSRCLRASRAKKCITGQAFLTRKWTAKLPWKWGDLMKFLPRNASAL